MKVSSMLARKEMPVMRSVVTHPVTVGIRLSLEQAQKLKAVAEADDRRPSTLARQLLSEAIDKYTKGEPVT